MEAYSEGRTLHMRILFRTELHKLLHSRCLWGLVFFNMLFLALLTGKNEGLSQRMQFLVSSDYFPMVSVLVAGYGIVVAHEYVSGYFKEAVCAGYLRWKVYLARYAAFLLGSLMIFFLPCLLAFFFTFLYEKDVLFAPQMENYFAGFAFLVLYCVCASAFFMMAAMLAKTYSGVVFVCIFYNVLLVVLHEVIPAEGLPGWIRYSFLGMRQGIFFQPMGMKKAVLICFSLLGQSVGYTGMGMLYFTKMELR